MYASRIQIVVAVDLDRLLRTTRDPLTLTDAGTGAGAGADADADAGAKVITPDSEIDLATSNGEFRATILFSFARCEGRRKAEHQKCANDQRAGDGHFFLGDVRLLRHAFKGPRVQRATRSKDYAFKGGVGRWSECENTQGRLRHPEGHRTRAAPQQAPTPG